MLSIHFTVDDLAKLRIFNSVGPALEGVFALDLFKRDRRPVFRGWRKEVRTALGPRLGDIDYILHRVNPVPDLLWLAGRQALAQTATGLTHAETKQFAPSVADFCRVAVDSAWPVTSNYLQERREARSRLVMSEGIDGLLHTLHPSVTWAPPTLQIRSAVDTDILLTGQGLVLTPSLFLSNVCLMAARSDSSKDLALAFPVPINGRVAGALQSSVTNPEGGLSALVGPTRAAALQIIADSCTTGELSERLGISLAGASQHAKVLRKAGLITTARNRNRSLHALTSLGVAILQGRSAGIVQDRSAAAG